MCDCTTGATPDDTGGDWPAAIRATCGVIASPRAMRRLVTILVLMIVLVIVTRLPWADLLSALR